MHVRDGTLREVVADLVAGDGSRRADHAQERARERAGTDAGLQYACAREDVGEHEYRSDVLRIDHLRAARHLEDVLGEGRAQRGQARAATGADGAAVGMADDVVVLDDAGMGVELAAVRKHHKVSPPPVVDEEHTFVGREQPAHDDVTLIGSPTARARMRQKAHTSAGVGAAQTEHGRRSSRVSSTSFMNLSWPRSRKPNTKAALEPGERSSMSLTRACIRDVDCPPPSGTPRRCSRCR